MEFPIESVRSRYFPFDLGNGFTLKSVSFADFKELTEQKMKNLFSDPLEKFFRLTPERAVPLRPLVAHYKTLHHEWIVITDSANEVVGWHTGEMEDSVTFYMRNTGVVPSCQNQKIYTRFLEHMLNYLAALGYERITSFHKTTNRRILITKLKLGFDVAGIEFTENWGPMVKLLKIIPEDRRRSFYNQFGLSEHLNL